jgi:hypothetical protein
VTHGAGPGKLRSRPGRRRAPPEGASTMPDADRFLAPLPQARSDASRKALCSQAGAPTIASRYYT